MAWRDAGGGQLEATGDTACSAVVQPVVCEVSADSTSAASECVERGGVIRTGGERSPPQPASTTMGRVATRVRRGHAQRRLCLDDVACSSIEPTTDLTINAVVALEPAAATPSGLIRSSTADTLHHQFTNECGYAPEVAQELAIAATIDGSAANRTRVSWRTRWVTLLWVASTAWRPPSVETTNSAAWAGGRGRSRRERVAAARLIQRYVRTGRVHHWPREAEAAARRIQHIVRRTRSRWPHGWDRSVSSSRPAIWREVRAPRCRFGLNLARPAEFVPQAERYGAAVRWYAQYVSLLRRLESGRTPMILELFCGAGGSSEGVRRAGGVSHGVDDTDQPEFRARFGDAWFTLSDALDVEVLRGLVRKHKPIAICASPPCEGFSTATFGGEPSRAPRLISATRDALRELGLPFVIENVLGARHELSADALCLRGQDAGLQTERPRLFEAGNGLSLRLDRAVASGGAALRARCCLGARSRYGRQDGFGMLQRVPCCCGNIYGIQGSCPWRCTAAEAAASMGVDLGHMSYRRLAQAVPPAYSALIFGQVAMHVAHTRYGVPPISFDDSLARPEWARRQMALLLRGAGGVAPQLGVELQPAATPATHRVSVGRLPETAISHACEGPSLRVVHEPGSRVRYCPTGGVGQNARVLEVDRYSVVEGREVSYVIRLESGAERHTVGGRLMAEDSHTADSSPPAEIDGAIRGGLMVSVPSAGWSLSESDFREVEYTYAGDYDQVWTGAGVPDYLAVIRPHTHVECPGRGASWRGHNSFVHVQPRHVRAAVPAMAEALQTEAAGTRISLVLPVRDADPSSSLGAMLAAAGFEQVCRFAARQTVAVGRWPGRRLEPAPLGRGRPGSRTARMPPRRHPPRP